MQFATGRFGLHSGRKIRAVTPSDTDTLPDGICRALYVATEGDLEFIAADDDDAVTIPVGALTTLNVAIKQVLTGTTATVYALY